MTRASDQIAGEAFAFLLGLALGWWFFHATDDDLRLTEARRRQLVHEIATEALELIEKTPGYGAIPPPRGD